MSETRNELAALALKLVIGGVFLLAGIDRFLAGDQLSEWGPMTGWAVGLLALLLDDVWEVGFPGRRPEWAAQGTPFLLLSAAVWLLSGGWFLLAKDLTTAFVYISLVAGASGVLVVIYNTAVRRRQPS